jgi:fibronectin type 3 domain-containing protein
MPYGFRKIVFGKVCGGKRFDVELGMKQLKVFRICALAILTMLLISGCVMGNNSTSPSSPSPSPSPSPQNTSHSVALSWAASSSVAGYNVYRSSQSGGPYSLLNSSAVGSPPFTDSNVQAGHQYFYVVTALDSSGVESSFSNEAAATVPTP